MLQPTPIRAAIESGRRQGEETRPTTLNRGVFKKVGHCNWTELRRGLCFLGHCDGSIEGTRGHGDGKITVRNLGTISRGQGRKMSIYDLLRRGRLSHRGFNGATAPKRGDDGVASTAGGTQLYWPGGANYFLCCHSSLSCRSGQKGFKGTLYVGGTLSFSCHPDSACNVKVSQVSCCNIDKKLSRQVFCLSLSICRFSPPFLFFLFLDYSVI